MPPIKKPKVDITAGAMIVIEIEGAQYRFDCTGANTKTGTTAKQVAKKIQDCVSTSIATATKRHKKKG
jgi:hypothetical protein